MAHSVHHDAPTRTHAEGVAALLDRYEILGVIGQGGMGTVYKGYHLVLKRFVAVKILCIDQIRSPALVARFLREMQAVGQMDHPNVVRAADGGEKNGLFYLVMEFLEGKNLSQLTAGRDGLRPSDACELVRQAALGLDYIHQKLVHRDIKPSNLLLTPAGVVKILDLGLARLHEADPGDKERTPEGCAVGTFDYMAPEQATGSGVVDGRTDIYSLGCTLFKLLTGRPPFSGPDYDSVARKLYAHGHVPLTALAAFQSVPERLRPVLLRMTAKDPAERYATAGEAARDLALMAAGSEPARLAAEAGGGEAALKPLPVPPPEELSRLTGAPTETRGNPATVPGGPAPARPFAWRRVAVGAAALLACVLVIGAWFFVLREQPRPDSPVKGPPPGAVPLPDEVPLPPPPGPLVALDKLPALDTTNLLGPDTPPTLIGFRHGDGRATGHWMPSRQQIEISPSDATLILLAADDRPAPGFDFEVLVQQRPWSGGVGLFWGYQEDAAVRAAREPGREFARCQGLLLESSSDMNGRHFYVERFAGSLVHNRDRHIALNTNSYSHEVLSNFAGEQLFQIVVAGGQLTAARFGDFNLSAVRRPEVIRRFAPADYRGAFGVFSTAANVTLRRPRVMPHAAD